MVREGKIYIALTAILAIIGVCLFGFGIVLSDAGNWKNIWIPLLVVGIVLFVIAILFSVRMSKKTVTVALALVFGIVLLLGGIYKNRVLNMEDVYVGSLAYYKMNYEENTGDMDANVQEVVDYVCDQNEWIRTDDSVYETEEDIKAFLESGEIAYEDGILDNDNKYMLMQFKNTVRLKVPSADNESVRCDFILVDMSDPHIYFGKGDAVIGTYAANG